MAATVSVAPRLRTVGGWALVVAAAAIGVLAFGPRPEVVGVLYLAAVTPLLARVDMAEHRLPNAIVLPGLAVAALGASAGWLRTGQPPITAVIAAGSAAMLLLTLHALGGFGMGDVKLGTVLALSLGALGAGAAAVGLLVGFCAGGVAALAVLVAGGAGQRMPFGPFLLFGYWWSIAASATEAVGAAG